ncbi:MAG: hypothetical protein RJA63_355 [Pseudomonadota bacterium]|jgi:type II secretion system protein H|nr:prepilin-type N-terminal cleavage/methylation domain-containing protein [Uliginosibacterium sp.]
MRDQRGFSLIEILVVLVIISVFTSLAVLTLESVQGRNNDEEVLRLQRLLEMAADYSDTRGTPLAVEFLPNGYRFSAMQTNGEWRLIFAPSPFAERSWPDGVQVARLEVDGVHQNEPLRLVFASEPPEYKLVLALPEGRKTLLGTLSGMVGLE